jgi:hypothetical protein
VQCLLGQIEVADEANERRQDAARVRAVEGFDLTRNRAVAQLNTSMGRTSTLPVRAEGIRDAT